MEEAKEGREGGREQKGDISVTWGLKGKIRKVALVAFKSM